MGIYDRRLVEFSHVMWVGRRREPACRMHRRFQPAPPRTRTILFVPTSCPWRRFDSQPRGGQRRASVAAFCYFFAPLALIPGPSPFTGEGSVLHLRWMLKLASFAVHALTCRAAVSFELRKPTRCADCANAPPCTGRLRRQQASSTRRCRRHRRCRNARCRR